VPINEEDLESISIYSLNFFTEQNYAAGILPVLPNQAKLYDIP